VVLEESRDAFKETRTELTTLQCDKEGALDALSTTPQAAPAGTAGSRTPCQRLQNGALTAGSAHQHQQLECQLSHCTLLAMPPVIIIKWPMALMLWLNG
jgi:hypothetical protein